MMLKLNRPVQLKRATRWVMALFVLSVLNMSMQMPLHAAMQQAMQQHNAVNAETMQKSHCEMQTSIQASQQADGVPIVSANASSDDICCCPPALCDAVEAQQDKLFQQAAALQLFASLAFYPASFELQLDTAQMLDVVSLRYQDLHYRQTSSSPLSFNTVLLI